MEKYKAELRKKLKIANICTIIGLILLVLNLVDSIVFENKFSYYKGYNFESFFYIAFWIPLGFRINLRRTLASDDLIKLHLKEDMDERKLMIKAKAASLAFWIMMCASCYIGLLYFRKDKELSFLFYGIAFIGIILEFGLKKYFSKKY